MSETDLAALTRSLAGQFAFCGIAVQRPGAAAEFHLATVPRLAATPRTMFRVASISKIVTAQTTLKAARAAGLDAPADAPAEDILGWRLRHPRHPDRKITLGMLAAHTSGLTDWGGYLLDPGTKLSDWIAKTGKWDAAPGTAFHYCNLGYILLGACAEMLGADRFDHLARRLVLDPLHVAGGFNWSGVPLRTRADRLPTFRRKGDDFLAQVDEKVGDGAISNVDGEDPTGTPWRIDADVAQLSPQGGLRTSMDGAVRLASGLARLDTDPLFTPAHGMIDDPEGRFDSYGWGVQMYRHPDFYPRPLVGHFGGAYGFLGGVWWDAAARTGFAYALNGLPDGDDSDGMRPQERQIFRALAAQIG
ncbi:MAG: serine hydrolase [Limimaricola sp.]|uniref:serine hydrolase domain-containing protein n=1 Tax=Limimaricola sp. TaxID=2211665 RepID=UPI001D27EB6E|nr:serine hydrolase [Limimaricola sp.]MBI1418809.1 serine hydrolase [Limimaricola sp.]